MTLTIYGPPQSRAMRTLWMAHEIGLDFRHERGFREDAVIPTQALLAAKPMGQVPAIDDDGFLLAESRAINIYLAKKHRKLAPRSLEDEAQTLRWSFWVMTAVEITLLDVLAKSRGLRGEEKDAEAAEAGIDFAKQPHLDTWLERCLGREAAVRVRR